MKSDSFAFFIMFIGLCVHVSGQDFTPGKERWPVKTSVTQFGPAKAISLRDLLNLPPPITFYTKNNRKEYQDKRFPEPVGEQRLREGDIITTEGYILLAALEKDEHGADADYHVQVRVTPDWADTCLVIEATYPPFVTGNDALRDSCRKVRDFFDQQILKGRKKASFGGKEKAVHRVRITGQLFFDAFHINTPPRGKQNSAHEKMKSYTCWEIHPVISIRPIPEK
jgi:hypothetical protein